MLSRGAVTRESLNLRKLPFVVIPIILALIAVPCGFSQATSGTITGSVTDPSGAAVPSAQVTIKDLDRGTQFTTTSNETGLFFKPQLPNGRYSVRAEAQGFQPVEQTNIMVSVDRETRLNLALRPAGVQQTVTVEANVAPVLQADRAEVSTTIPERQLVDLPTLGQNVTTLETLAPGTVRNTYDIGVQENPQGGVANNTNGLLFGFSNRQIDGADDQDAVLGIAVVNPPPDSLDQMKVTTSNYDAEFGRAAGSFVQYTTKSGTNDWHGGVFEYLRNDYFNATNPFTEGPSSASGSSTGGKLPLRFNQFGGSLGGPLVTNKLFIFGVYQGQRQRIGSGFLTNVPTAAQRAGDLTSLGGGIIPPSAISPVSAQILNLLPLPNRTGTSNYEGTGSVKFDTNQYDGRLDWYLSDNDRTFFRYDYFGSDINVPGIFGSVLGGPSVYPQLGAGNSLGRNQNLAANWNHVFSPSLLLNVRYSYFRYRINVLPVDFGTTTATDLGIPNINLGTPNTGGIPNFIISGSELGDIRIGTSVGTNAPLHQLEKLNQFSVSTSKQAGNHQIKFGGDYRHVSNYRNASDSSQRGQFTFSSGVVGAGSDSFAAFLEGLPSQFQRYAYLGDPTEYEQDVFTFAQDQWRVTPKLTLTYGLRWELYTAPYADTGNGANFDLKTGMLLVANTGQVDRYTNINTRKNNFAPRLGVAYQITPRTVVRAGYGRSFFPNFFGIQISHNYPVNFNQSITASSGTALPFNLSQGPPLPTAPAIPASGMLPLPADVSATAIPLERKTGSVDMYNIAIQQEIAKNFSVQVAYVGNVARHLYSFQDANAPVPGPGVSNENRPYFPTFGYVQDITLFCNCENSNYNSLQVAVEKRLSSFYSLTGQYTWSKTMNFGDNSAEFGPYDLRSQYGPAGFDRKHTFSLGHVLQIPVGPGTPFWSNMNGFEKAVIAGWQFSGVTTIYSGRPFTPVWSDNTSLNSTYSLRAQIVGDPFSNVPAGLAYNPAAFAQPAPFTQGNAGRNSLRGPNYVNADWELSKEFALSERSRLRFGWQNFNVFNHPNLGLPANAVDQTTAGTYTSLENFALPRTMQFNLRLSF